jgi:hypothetical protein
MAIFFDILCGGGEQALAGDAGYPSEPCVAVSEPLLGVGEGSLDCFFSPFVDGLSP